MFFRFTTYPNVYAAPHAEQSVGDPNCPLGVIFTFLFVTRTAMRVMILEDMYVVFWHTDCRGWPIVFLVALLDLRCFGPANVEC